MFPSYMHPTKLRAARVLHVCASSCTNVHIFQRTPKKLGYKVLSPASYCINVFTLKLICCNCFAVIYIIVLNAVNAQKICSSNPT